MLTELHQRTITQLSWPQFVSLCAEMQIDIAQFSRGATPAELVLDFDNQVAIHAGARGVEDVAMLELVTEAIKAVVGIAAEMNAVESGSEKARHGLNEMFRLTSDPAESRQILAALTPAKTALDNLDVGLACMLKCKQAHEALHNLDFKIDVLLSTARAWAAAAVDHPDKSRLTFELKRITGGCMEDARRFSSAVQQLPPPWNFTLGSVAQHLDFALSDVKRAAGDPAGGDPETPIVSVLLPYTSQTPSSIQNVIAQIASSLPFDTVISAVAVCRFNSRDATVTGLESLRDSIRRLEQMHHDWQSVDIQARAMKTPVANLENNSSMRRQAVYLVKMLRQQLDDLCLATREPWGAETISQVEKLQSLLADVDSDFYELRTSFEELLNNVSARFFTVDENLLAACREMEPLSDPLRNLANAV